MVPLCPTGGGACDNSLMKPLEEWPRQTSRPTILVIEDDALIREGVTEHLQRALGADVRACPTLTAALGMPAPDIAVLDLGLPDADGLEALIRLRDAMPAVLMLVATAHGTLAERVEGLRRGADDYIVKPFSLLELEARVQALLRRRGPQETQAAADLTWDPGARQVWRQGEALDLTPLEYLVFSALAARHGEALSRPELLRIVIGPNFYGYERLVDVHVGHLRHKLDPSDSFRYIATVRGYGYRWDAPPPRPQGSGHAG